MESTVLQINTGSRRGAVDFTADVQRFAADKPDGLVNVFVPHATAGVAIIEAGAGSDADLIERIDELLPRRDDLYRHRHGSPGHGADHVLPAFVSPSVSVPVIDGMLVLGTWQSILLVDPNGDNAVRRVRLSHVPG